MFMPPMCIPGIMGGIPPGTPLGMPPGIPKAIQYALRIFLKEEEKTQQLRQRKGQENTQQDRYTRFAVTNREGRHNHDEPAKLSLASMGITIFDSDSRLIESRCVWCSLRLKGKCVWESSSRMATCLTSRLWILLFQSQCGQFLRAARLLWPLFQSAHNLYRIDLSGLLKVASMCLLLGVLLLRLQFIIPTKLSVLG